jgi:purine-cytosine permease-like protein
VILDIIFIIFFSMLPVVTLAAAYLTGRMNISMASLTGLGLCAACLGVWVLSWFLELKSFLTSMGFSLTFYLAVMVVLFFLMRSKGREDRSGRKGARKVRRRSSG